MVLDQQHGGKRTQVAPGISLWTPAWQECTCGAMEEDYNESNSRRYTPCCQLTFLRYEASGEDGLIGIGRVWLNARMRPKMRPSAAVIRAIVADCSPPPAGMTTALYRRFDADRALLYVGVSDDLPARARWHERNSPWAQFVAERTTEWYGSRSEAETVEATVIKAELPLFNKQHAAPGRRVAAAQYLLQQGRLAGVVSEEFELEEPQK